MRDEINNYMIFKEQTSPLPNGRFTILSSSATYLFFFFKNYVSIMANLDDYNKITDLNICRN